MNHPRQPARSVTTTVRAMRGRPRGGLVAMPDPRTEDEQCLRGLADGFLSRMAARAYSPGSVEAHAWALKYFIDWAVSRRLLTPAAFTRPLLEEYQLFLHQFRSERTGALLAVNTQLARLGVIRRFFAWLCRENIILANPAADLDLPRKQARLLPKSLAIEEIDRLLALPDVSSPFGARDRALLELFYATGVRRTEMVRLELGDFDPAQRTLHVRRGKGGKSRLLPVGDRAARWLSHYLTDIRPLLAGHPGERALFLSGYGSPFSPAYLGNWVARQMKKAGIEKKGSCHLFRHSCATHMLEGGADIRYIQQMLGHARLDTTQIYTEVSIRALTEAHARSHPHGRLPASGEGPVDSNGASGSLSPVPEPPIGPVSVLASVLPATTVSHPTEDPEEPTAMEVDSDKPPTDPAVGTFQGMLEACGWPDGTDGGVIEYGYRYLDTQLGRWLSRDPIGEEGGLNIYSFAQNNGVGMWDLLGLWTEVKREKGPWASTCAQENDSWAGLAAIVGLLPDEAPKWVKGYDGPVPTPGKTYWVPNTIPIYFAKSVDILWGAIITQGHIRTALKNYGEKFDKAGFKIVWALDASSVPTFEKLWSEDGIYSIAFGGHGEDLGLLGYQFLADPDGGNGSNGPFNAPPYKLNTIYALFCGANTVSDYPNRAIFVIAGVSPEWFNWENNFVLRIGPHCTLPVGKSDMPDWR